MLLQKITVVANISKFLFWKRITTHITTFTHTPPLLQIYQSSFFESESQRFSIFKFCEISCCKYIKVPFLKANHNWVSFATLHSWVVANISKFLFWKRITTEIASTIAPKRLLQIYQSSFFESESQRYEHSYYQLWSCCKYIKVPFLKANHNTNTSYPAKPQVVANISKFLFWKRITTEYVLFPIVSALLQIYQSSFFESESQQQILLIWAFLRCCKYIKVPFLKANHNTFQ